MQRPVYALTAAAALAALVITLATGQLGALGVLVAVPVAAVLSASPRVVAAAAAGSLAVAALAGIAGDAFGTPHISALAAIAAASVPAFALASERRVRDRRAAFAAFMGEATTLLACSLDFDTTAKAVASIPVPQLADWTLVELLAPDGAVERRAASRPDPPSELLAAAIAAADESARGPRAGLWPDLPDELLKAWANGDEAQLDSLRSVRARAALRVLLRSPERVLGTLTLLVAGSGRTYTETDLRRAEELATRCSLAVENANRFRAARRSGERRFARRTDQPLAPDRPPSATD